MSFWFMDRCQFSRGQRLNPRSTALQSLVRMFRMFSVGNLKSFGTMSLWQTKPPKWRVLVIIHSATFGKNQTQYMSTKDLTPLYKKHHWTSFAATESWASCSYRVNSTVHQSIWESSVRTTVNWVMQQDNDSNQSSKSSTMFYYY